MHRRSRRALTQNVMATMFIDNDLIENCSFVSCAIASDGGSLAVVMAIGEAQLVSLILDRKIGTKTPNRLYLEGETRVLLESAEEKRWLPVLQRFRNEQTDDSEANLLKEMIQVLETRIES